ncbi:hypothetical protein PhCBS80983_g06156 [Powellomyces hirtus]|uniref:DUF5672 domain-containing protein n=1 Tax=Powellomyces hirtus TaxID=109895 RepID=A0A507DQV6_9FUNG|nr:hypothetical protein PhCBS80983_g06156 [Powellomyces hirtus]
MADPKAALGPVIKGRKAAILFGLLGGAALVIFTSWILLFFSQFLYVNPERHQVPEAPAHIAQTFNRTKLGLLIETRPMTSLVPILLHYMATTPADWPFHVFYSDKNAHLLSTRTLQPYIQSGRLSTTLLGPDVAYNSSRTVSEFLTSRWIWDQIEVEHLLFFQLDAMLCSNSDQSINDFIHYDWIGAPWPHLRDLRGGNGGFSMRRKSRMLRCIDKLTWSKQEALNEDVWFSRCLATFSDAVLPTYEESMGWAIEAQESKRYMGIHKPWGSLKVATNYEFCPEAAMLFLP